MLLSSFLFFAFPIINLKLICYAIQKKRPRNFLYNNPETVLGSPNKICNRAGDSFAGLLTYIEVNT